LRLRAFFTAEVLTPPSKKHFYTIFMGPSRALDPGIRRTGCIPLSVDRGPAEWSASRYPNMPLAAQWCVAVDHVTQIAASRLHANQPH